MKDLILETGKCKPVTQYFNIYTNYKGNKGTGLLYDTLEAAKESWRHNPASSAELFSYSEGVVKKVACHG